MKSLLTPGPSNQSSHDLPAGVMILLLPTATISTSMMASGNATGLGNRTAWLLLLLKTLVWDFLNSLTMYIRKTYPYDSSPTGYVKSISPTREGRRRNDQEAQGGLPDGRRRRGPPGVPGDPRAKSPRLRGTGHGGDLRIRGGRYAGDRGFRQHHYNDTDCLVTTTQSRSVNPGAMRCTFRITLQQPQSRVEPVG